MKIITTTIHTVHPPNIRTNLGREVIELILFDISPIQNKNTPPLLSSCTIIRGVFLLEGVFLLKIFACGASEKAQFFGPAGQNERFAITIQMRKRDLGVVRAAGEKILGIFMSRMQFL